MEWSLGSWKSHTWPRDSFFLQQALEMAVGAGKVRAHWGQRPLSPLLSTFPFPVQSLGEEFCPWELSQVPTAPTDLSVPPWHIPASQSELANVSLPPACLPARPSEAGEQLTSSSSWSFPRHLPALSCWVSMIYQAWQTPGALSGLQGVSDSDNIRFLLTKKHILGSNWAQAPALTPNSYFLLESITKNQRRGRV